MPTPLGPGGSERGTGAGGQQAAGGPSGSRERGGGGIGVGGGRVGDGEQAAAPIINAPRPASGAALLPQDYSSWDQSSVAELYRVLHQRSQRHGVSFFRDFEEKTRRKSKRAIKKQEGRRKTEARSLALYLSPP